MLLGDAVGPLSTLGLEGLDVVPGFFIAPAMNPRTVCFCQPILSMISASVAPFFRWSIATTCAVLLPSRGPAVSCAFAAFLALGAFLAPVAFLVALAFGGRALGGLCATFGLAFLLRLRGLAESLDALPDAAGGDLAVLELLHRLNAGQAIPNGYESLGGQPATSSASSFWLRSCQTGLRLRRRPPRGSQTP